MGRKRKFTDLELGEAIAAGLSKPEICQKFGVSRQAVDQRAAKLGLAVGQMALLHQGAEIAQKQIDAHAQLLRINESVHQSLALLEGRLQDENGEPRPAILDLQLKAVAEVRKQLELLAKVATELLEAKRMAAVQQVILQEIGAESAECRARIIRRLGGLQGPGLLFSPDGWA